MLLLDVTELKMYPPKREEKRREENKQAAQIFIKLGCLFYLEFIVDKDTKK